MVKWTEKDIPDLKGRVAVVTGSNSGIGWEAALQLAGHGARTILACRDAKRAETAAANIRLTFPQAKVETMALDLSSLASVRAFSKTLHEGASRIDLLVNNAGVMAIPRRTTADGFEMQIGTNYLGHFALTGLLMDLLLPTIGSRVVTLSSTVHWFGKINFGDLHGARSYWRWPAYSQSKLACLMFTQELQRRLAANGALTISVGCHPGYAATNLQQVGPSMSQSIVSAGVFDIGNRFVAQSAARGALPTLFAATSPDVHGGDYFGPRGLFGLWGTPALANVSSRAKDAKVSSRLWEVSEELTNVKYQWSA